MLEVGLLIPDLFLVKTTPGTPLCLVCVYVCAYIYMCMCVYIYVCTHPCVYTPIIASIMFFSGLFVYMFIIGT